MTNWDIPLLKIKELEIKLIQGGMGVRISGPNLASAVANEGGAGIIAAVGLGDMEDKSLSYDEVSKNALRETIRKTRAKSNGVIGVNIMHALSNYSSLVETAVEENVDIIISGAGLPRDLPDYLNGKNIKLIPIVSSVKATELLCKSWSRRGHLPDAIIVEGPKSGGHQGYSFEDLANPEFVSSGLETRLSEVLNFLRLDQKTAKIPVIVAGGIYYGGDIDKFLKLGASGVQMATRFVTTYECDASIEFKKAYLDCKEGDLRIIHSPVGMPGRAINNSFLDRVEAGEEIPKRCDYRCLKTCNPRESPYCIAKALIEAGQGKLENGFAFAGRNAYLSKEIISVKELFENLNQEFKDKKTSN